MATKDLSQPRAIDSACFATGKRIGRGRGTHAEPILQQGDTEHILGGLVRQRGTRSTAQHLPLGKKQPSDFGNDPDVDCKIGTTKPERMTKPNSA